MSRPEHFSSQLGQTHLIRSIYMLFGHDEDLLRFFLSHKQPALRMPAKNLIHASRNFPQEEQLMIRVALDFWNRRGATRVADLLNHWESEQWSRFILAVCHLEEIESDVRDTLIVAADGEPIYFHASQSKNKS